MLFPVSVLVGVTAIVFGPLLGTVYALIGATLSGAMTFAIGRHLSKDTVRALAGRRLNDLSRRLGERGLLAIIFARVVPVGPFSIVNIVAGASHIRWRDFLLGTVIGLVPGVTVASIFVDRVAAAIQEPGAGTFALLAAVGAALVALLWAIARKLRHRAEAKRPPRRVCMATEAADAPHDRIAGRIHGALRVTTWNIHGAVGTDRRYAPTRIVDVLHELDADVVALQEVPLQQAHDTFLADLERATGYHAVSGPLLTRRGTDFGNAVLSRHAVDRVAHLDLTVDNLRAARRARCADPRRGARLVARAGNASRVASRRAPQPGEKAPRRGRERAVAADDPHGRSERVVPVGSPAALAARAFSGEALGAADVSRASSRVRARPDLDLAGGLPAPVALACEPAGAGRIGPPAADGRGRRLTLAPSRGRYPCSHGHPDLLPTAANFSSRGRGIDLAKWAVIACDQYTSEPDYWERVAREVGDAPSTLHLIFPEAYLGAPDAASRIGRIQDTMRQLPFRRSVRRARRRLFTSSERSAIESAAA